MPSVIASPEPLAAHKHHRRPRPQIAAFLPNWVAERGLEADWVGSFIAVQSCGMLVTALFGLRFVERVGNSVALRVGLAVIVSSRRSCVPFGPSASVAVASTLLLGVSCLPLASVSFLVNKAPAPPHTGRRPAADGLRAAAPGGPTAGPHHHGASISWGHRQWLAAGAA
eukprot:625828-Prymnesium_polylepis.1